MIIKVFPLVTGVDIIAELLPHLDSSDFYSIKNPMQMYMEQTGGQMKGGLVPAFMPYIDISSDDVVKLYKDKLLYQPLEPVEGVKQNYNTMFGSGIVVPPQGIIC